MTVRTVVRSVLRASALWLASSAAASAETLLERGTYLMNGIVACGACHTPKFGPMRGVELAGGLPFRDEMFEAFAPNITPDEDTGIGRWTDAQIVRAFREGKRPDGTTIGPPMPITIYRGLSDRDARAIVAYLRQVTPVRHRVRKSTYRMPLPPAYGAPVRNVPDVKRHDKIAYGGYLAGPAGHCIECHTPMVDGHRDFRNRLGAGGMRFQGPWGVVFAANITPDRKTGLGDWTDAEIKAAITRGVRPSGATLKGPMAFPFYRNIRESDLNAIVAYLRSIKPVRAETR